MKSGKEKRMEIGRRLKIWTAFGWEVKFGRVYWMLNNGKYEEGEFVFEDTQNFENFAMMREFKKKLYQIQNHYTGECIKED